MPDGKQPLPAGASVSLTTIEGPDEGARYTVSATPAFIGTAENMDVSLPGQGVAVSHARLILNEAGYFIEDLGSGGTTKVNDLAAKRIKLNNGDIIEVGGFKLLLQLTLPQTAMDAVKAPAAKGRVKKVWLAGFTQQIRDWFANQTPGQAGVDARPFQSGEEVLVALSEALESEDPPQALILDLKLPIINGINVAVAVRAFELGFNRLDRVEIIFMFTPPPSTNFEKVLDFLKPARVAPPGDSDGLLRQNLLELLKSMPN